MTTETPAIVFWKTSTGTVLRSIRRPPDAPSINHEKRQTKWWIPFGAESFSLDTHEWHPLEELPPEWGLKRIAPPPPKHRRDHKRWERDHYLGKGEAEDDYGEAEE